MYCCVRYNKQNARKDSVLPIIFSCVRSGGHLLNFFRKCPLSSSYLIEFISFQIVYSFIRMYMTMAKCVLKYVLRRIHTSQTRINTRFIYLTTSSSGRSTNLFYIPLCTYITLYFIQQPFIFHPNSTPFFPFGRKLGACWA